MALFFLPRGSVDHIELNFLFCFFPSGITQCWEEGLYEQTRQQNHKQVLDLMGQYLPPIEPLGGGGRPFHILVAGRLRGPLNRANFANASQLRKHLC